MNGKDKCKALKEIRRQIAQNNDIAYVVEDCKHKGKCKGTCPKCEAEVRYLENELAKKKALGQKVAVAGVSLSLAASFSACTPSDVVYSLTYPISEIFDSVGGNDLEGAPTIDPGYEIEGGITYYDPPLEGEPTIDPAFLDPDSETDPEVIEGDVCVDDSDITEGDPCEENPDGCMDDLSEEDIPYDDNGYELEGSIECVPVEGFDESSSIVVTPFEM